ncbi:hypothetical protein VTO42DRAFT_8498 [Malbranchea cinnamomea]
MRLGCHDQHPPIKIVKESTSTKYSKEKTDVFDPGRTIFVPSVKICTKSIQLNRRIASYTPPMSTESKLNIKKDIQT